MLEHKQSRERILFLNAYAHILYGLKLEFLDSKEDIQRNEWHQTKLLKLNLT